MLKYLRQAVYVSVHTDWPIDLCKYIFTMRLGDIRSIGFGQRDYDVSFCSKKEQNLTMSSQLLTKNYGCFTCQSLQFPLETITIKLASVIILFSEGPVKESLAILSCNLCSPNHFFRKFHLLKPHTSLIASMTNLTKSSDRVFSPSFTTAQKQVQSF